ncbi:uncharacterized protein RAG0_02806 [Rhynchosporium agropyri]|uniref:non-specific serine/threonine protein kinase n=1 Tax=Rhynchosporium agropyri TaxID=914238 RepID=A0A1E1K2U6_9HELO|nr:uncharacterized protein RAG0_02806 [Rhynchosporium agropyri]
MPISPPQCTGVRGVYRCIVNYNHEPFSITWSGSQEYPDLESIPSLKNAELFSVQQSSEVAAIWRNSELLDYGSYALIRIAEHGSFPVLKLADSDEVSMKLIQYEFDILAKLTEQGLPVVDYDYEPILENWVVYGYRMEKLSKIEASELLSRAEDIKQVIDQFHRVGFSHGDVGPSNIMTKDGRITFIDLSFAGPLGTTVPSSFPSWVYIDSKFSIGSNLERFGRYIVPK